MSYILPTFKTGAEFNSVFAYFENSLNATMPFPLLNISNTRSILLFT